MAFDNFSNPTLSLDDTTLLSFFDDIVKEYSKIYKGDLYNEFISFKNEIFENSGLKGLYLLKCLMNNFSLYNDTIFRISNFYLYEFIDKYHENMIYYGMNDFDSLEQAFKDTFEYNSNYHYYLCTKNNKINKK